MVEGPDFHVMYGRVSVEEDMRSARKAMTEDEMHDLYVQEMTLKGRFDLLEPDCQGAFCFWKREKGFDRR